ncbi:AsmA family protein [Pseudoxanthomonas sp. USHLN014]|uniref:AsmA family protein n=1 Tax=Pseudoxanthomonas sp. USHLN014 TaxID=3081297 RepID=UPI00301BEB14
MTPADTTPRPFVRAHPVLTALGIVAVLIVLLIIFWDWNWFKGPVERAVSAKTGRAFHIDGNLDVDLGRISTIRADGLRLANADWALKTAPEMATVQHLELDLDVPQLLFHRNVSLPAIRITQPVVELQNRTTAQGGGNWNFKRDEPSQDGGMDVRFGAVIVDALRLHYLDPPNKTDLRVQASSGKPDAQYRAPPIDLTGAGRWGANAFTLKGRIQSPLDLTQTERPYRIDLNAAAGATKAHARGTLIDPLHLGGFDLRMALSGQDLADLYPLIGVALPETPPYAIDGTLTRAGNVWHYDKFAGKVGDSDLGGSAAVTVGGPRLKLDADLVSKRLDFDDLAGFINAPSKGGPAETRSAKQEAQAAKLAASPRVLPQERYNLSKLRAMDADVRLKATRINAPKLPIDDMDAHLLLDDGLLQLQPLNFGVAGGDIRSNIRMDARQPVIRTRAQIAVRTLNLGQLFPSVKLTQDAIGRIGGGIDIDTTGNSIAEMAANANGQLGVGMGKGHLPQLLVELAGLDVTQSLGYLFDRNKQVPIRCAFADFGIKDGLMQTRAMAFDTTDTLVLGEGTINLKDESLDLVLRPRPKDRSILSFRTPLDIGGTFKDPSFRPDLKKLGLRGAVALALGSIAPPAALLATLDLGGGEDANCGGQYAK